MAEKCKIGVVQTTYQRSVRSDRHMVILHRRIGLSEEIHAIWSLKLTLVQITQIAYEKKAKTMEGREMQTRDLCKQRTNGYEPETISVSFIAVWCRQMKFTQICSES